MNKLNKRLQEILNIKEFRVSDVVFDLVNQQKGTILTTDEDKSYCKYSGDIVPFGRLNTDLELIDRDFSLQDVLEAIRKEVVRKDYLERKNEYSFSPALKKLFKLRNQLLDLWLLKNKQGKDLTIENQSESCKQFIKEVMKFHKKQKNLKLYDTKQKKR